MKILRSELAYVITALHYKSIGIKTNLNKWLRTFADNLVSVFALLMCGPSAASRWWAGRNCSAWLHSLQLRAWGALLLTHPASFVLLCVTWGSSEGASRNNRITFYIRFHPDLLHRDNNLMPHSWVSISSYTSGKQAEELQLWLPSLLWNLADFLIWVTCSGNEFWIISHVENHLFPQW